MSMYADTFCHLVLYKIYSKTSIIRTPLGPLLTILFIWRCPDFRGFIIIMYTCQCEGYKIGKSNGVLLKEVAAFQRCPLTEVHCKQ